MNYHNNSELLLICRRRPDQQHPRLWPNEPPPPVIACRRRPVQLRQLKLRLLLLLDNKEAMRFLLPVIYLRLLLWVVPWHLHPRHRVE